MPDSLTIADAANWYRASVPLIAGASASRPDYAEPFPYAWSLKSRLRLAGALALYDQEAVDEFLRAFPLPTQHEMLLAAFAASAEGGDFHGAALATLLTVCESERKAFPGTVGECIGLELWDGKKYWVMTEDGWAAKP
ncbi:hypothetical protein [Lysobacter sp. CA199]|uniref:hypothetical protein n=1 Tax=Lysobacter sp. CA199 TaxID=3455608 RepID=UPI003F8D03DE